MKEIELIKSNSDDSVAYRLPVRDDLYCLNCGVPSVHHRLYPASIGCRKSGNDWHLTCKGETICLIPPHVIKKIFESLSQAYKEEHLSPFLDKKKKEDQDKRFLKLENA